MNTKHNSPEEIRISGPKTHIAWTPDYKTNPLQVSLVYEDDLAGLIDERDSLRSELALAKGEIKRLREALEESQGISATCANAAALNHERAEKISAILTSAVEAEELGWEQDEEPSWMTQARTALNPSQPTGGERE